MFGLFEHKKRIDKLKLEVQDSFNYVKKDFNKVGKWICHLDDKHRLHVNEISGIKNQLLDIQNDLIEIKDCISFFCPQLPVGLYKQSQTDGIKQTIAKPIQTSIQTPVQTCILNNFTVMERALIWALLNSEMKLSYEDLATLLGKDKSTIRGQINIIRQKNNGLIMEICEINGKKRVYIPNDIKSIIMKGIKVKINKKKSKSEN